jgi:hypothetical protein
MTTCASQVSSRVTNGLQVGFSYRNRSERVALPRFNAALVNASSHRADALGIQLRSRLLQHALFPTLSAQSLPKASPHRQARQRCHSGSIRALAQDEFEGGGDSGSVEDPPEGWERDAAAARVAELAQKAGSRVGTGGSSASRRKLSFTAITAAAEGAKKGGVNGAIEGAALDEQAVGSEGSAKNERSAVRGARALREVALGRDLGIGDVNTVSEGFNRAADSAPNTKPWVRDLGGSGAPKRRTQEVPGGGAGLGERTGPWIREGSERAKTISENGSVTARRGAFEGDTLAAMEGRSRRQSPPEPFVRDGLREPRGGLRKPRVEPEEDDPFAKGSYSTAFSNSYAGGDLLRTEDARGSGFGNWKGLASNRSRDDEADSEDDRQSSQGGGSGSRKGGWGDVENDVWIRDGSQADVSKAPKPKPVWRSQSGGEEVLGTKAWVAMERAAREGGSDEQAAWGGGARRGPRGEDPRGAPFRREEMGVRVWDERDNDFARGTGGSKQSRGVEWDPTFEESEAEWSGNEEEGGQEINSWAPKGSSGKVGMRGSRLVDGRGSLRGAYKGTPRDTQDSRAPAQPFEWPDKNVRGSAQRFLRAFPSEQDESQSKPTRARAPILDDAYAARTSGSQGRLEATREREISRPAAPAEERRERRKLQNVKLAGPGCYGCGARLQVSHPGGPGYLRPDVYELVSGIFLSFFHNAFSPISYSVNPDNHLSLRQFL